MTSFGCGNSCVSHHLYQTHLLILMTGPPSRSTTEGIGRGSFEGRLTMLVRSEGTFTYLYIVEHFHWDILTTLHDHDHLHLGPPHEVRDTGSFPHACMQCAACVKSKGGCGAHLFRIDGIVNPVRRLFDSSQCCSCLREFHTFSKLKAHLLCVNPCRQDLLNRRHFVGPSAGAGSTNNTVQEALHDGLLPPLRAEGPCPLPAAPREEVEYDVALYEAVCL